MQLLKYPVHPADVSGMNTTQPPSSLESHVMDAYMASLPAGREEAALDWLLRDIEDEEDCERWDGQS